MRLRAPILVVLSVAFLAGGATRSYAVNILFNSGFETGALAPWFNSNDLCGGCTWSVTSADAHTGTYSATVLGNRLIEQTFSAVSTSLISEASLWLRMPGTGIAAVYFAYSDSTFAENIVQPGRTWAKFDMTSFLAPGKSLTGFGVYGCTGCIVPGTTFADDFVVDARVPEPSTFALLALGGGLAAWRRRARSRS